MKYGLIILAIVFLTMGQMQEVTQGDQDKIYFGVDNGSEWVSFGYTDTFEDLNSLSEQGSIYWFSINNFGVI